MRHKERENYRKKKLYKVLPFMAALCVCGSSIGGTVYAETVEPTVDMLEETSEVDENTTEETTTEEDTTEENTTAESTPAENADTPSENEPTEPAVSDGRSFQTEIAKPDNVEQDGYDVIFAIDNSGSVKKKQREARCNALKSIVNRMVGSDFNVGIIYFSGEAYNTYGLTSMKNEDSAKEVLEHLTTVVEGRPDKNTNISSALEVAQTFLADSNPNRQPVIVLCSDGTNENKEHDLAYQEEADAATAEIVRQLKNRENASPVPIYCVYLKQLYKDADKLALEEEKLKEIVNYCPEEGESYEDFSADRFYTVTNEEVENLTSSFEEVFFKMQNNVRKRDLNFDDSWKDQLYIPSLAVSKVNIYINKSVDLANSYNDGREPSSEPKSWKTEDATFFSLENPSAGDWWFQITNSDVDLSGISGQVTYIANPGVSVEMVLLDNDNTDGEKQYQLRVHFYDENGEEITVDPGATVQVYRENVDENGEPALFMPYLETENGLITSVPQTWEGYGDYNYQVRVSYKDYIDLHYTFNTLTVAGAAPVTTDVTEGVYETDKTETENGSVFQFALKESDLWKDPDGSEVTVTGITQVNTANPVTYEQRDGYVYITAEKAGDVEFSLDLENTSGMTAVVSVKGKIKDLGVKRKVVAGVVGTGILAVIVLIVLAVHESQKKKKRESIYGDFQEIAGKVEDTCNKCEMQIKELETKKAMLTEYVEGSSDGIQEMAAGMSAGLQTIFGVQDYMAADYCKKQFEDVKKWENSLRLARTSMGNAKKEMADLQEKDLSTVWSQMEKVYESAKKNYVRVRNIEKNLAKKKEDTENIIQNVEEAGEALCQFIESDIKCSLTVTNLSCNLSAVYRQSAKEYGKQISGYYELGSIRQIAGAGNNPARLENMVSPLDIYVYGYEEDKEKNPQEGLQLKGKDAFSVKNLNTDEAPVKTDHAVLLKGNTYELTVENIEDLGKVSMCLTVG